MIHPKKYSECAYLYFSWLQQQEQAAAPQLRHELQATGHNLVDNSEPTEGLTTDNERLRLELLSVQETLAALQKEKEELISKSETMADRFKDRALV